MNWAYWVAAGAAGFLLGYLLVVLLWAEHFT